MDPLLSALAGLLLGLLVGSVAAWLLGRSRSRSELAQALELERTRFEGEAQTLRTRLELREQELERERSALEKLQAEVDRLETALREGAAQAAALEARWSEETRRSAETQQLLQTAEARLKDAFEALAGRALEQSTRTFLDLAQETFGKARAESQSELEEKRRQLEGLLQPLSEQLRRSEEQVRELERARHTAYGELAERLSALSGAQAEIVQATQKLATALRRPEVRGSWGELQLRRAVELAGLVEHVDFVSQATLQTGEQMRRPDLVIQLPGGGTIAVDAKAPLDAYLQAVEAETEEARREALGRHAGQVREKLREVASRGYANALATSPDLVVLFLPLEAMFAAALEREPRLLEEGFQQGVLLATPVTLVALLKTVAHAWRQEALAQNAREIAAAGRELHQRLARFAEHLSQVGRSLSRSVEAYNQAVGSFESRLLPQARRLESLEAGNGRELASPAPAAARPRTLSAENPNEEVGA